MLLTELFAPITDEEEVYEGAKLAWARVGNKIVRKYRCTDGPRQGRIVSSPAQCHKPYDLKKRVKFRQTRLAKGLRMKRRRGITMKRNPASLRLQRMNKALSGKS